MSQMGGDGTLGYGHAPDCPCCQVMRKCFLCNEWHTNKMPCADKSVFEGKKTFDVPLPRFTLKLEYENG